MKINPIFLGNTINDCRITKKDRNKKRINVLD